MMESGIQLNIAGSPACGCCHMSSDSLEGSSCAERSNIFTSREMGVLRKIREHSGRAREVKHQIERLGSGSESLTLKKTALDELERLRAEREVLEAERIAAAEERMRLLGHL